VAIPGKKKSKTFIEKMKESLLEHIHDHRNGNYRFCPLCGGAFSSKKIKDNEPLRLVCGDCAYIFYLDPKIAACSILEIDGKIILLKRGIEPQKGKWVMPGGYVDRGEEVKEAAQRETLEECGIRTKIRDLLGVYSYPGNMVVVVIYLADYLSGDLIAGDESTEVRRFAPQDIPWDKLAFPSTRDALKDYLRRR
jgi:ADP-ribose pyrophosphatase YjhB (NUDIX family)/ribosomal protein S27AE